MARLLRLVGMTLALLGPLGCGAGTVPAPGGGGDDPAALLVPTTPVAGRVALPAGPARDALAGVGTALGDAPVSADGSFGDLPLPSAPGLGGVLGVLLGAGGAPLAPVWIGPEDAVLDAGDVALALVRLTSLGQSIPPEDAPVFEGCARRGEPFARLEAEVGAALATRAALFEAADGGLLALAAEAAAAALACAVAGPAPGATLLRASAGPDACTPAVPFDEVTVASRPMEGGSCEAHGLNATMVFYELEVREPGRLTTSYLLSPRRRAWALPPFQAPEPPTQAPLHLPAGSYEATAWKGLTAGADPYAEAVRDSPSGQAFWANLAYGVCLLLDLKVKAVSAVGGPAASIAGAFVSHLLADPNHVTVLVTQLTGSPQQVDAVHEYRRAFWDGLRSPELLLGLGLPLVEAFAEPLAQQLGLLQQTVLGAVPLVVSKDLLKGLAKGLGKALDALNVAQQHVPFAVDLLTARPRIDFDFSIGQGPAGQTVGTSALQGPPRLALTWSPVVPDRGEWVQLDAGASAPLVPSDGPLTVRWDLDLDGVFERQGPLSEFGTARRQLLTEGPHELVIELEDRLGRVTRSRRLVFVRDRAAETGLRGARLVPLPAAPGHVALADLDRDQDLDAVVTLPAPGQLQVLRHDVADGYVEAARLDLGFLPGPCALGDVDGDGDPDLVVVSPSGPSLVPFRNDGPLGFVRQAGLALPAGASVPRLRVADLGGDAFHDLLFVDASAAVLHVWRGDGGFAFGGVGAASRGAYAVGAGPADVLAADLDGDGDLDVVTASAGADTLGVLENVGAGALALRQAALPAGAADGGYGAPERLAAGDLLPSLGDELVVSNARSGTLSLFAREASSPTLLLAAVPADWALGAAPGPLGVADLDRDGQRDLVRLSRGGSAITASFLDGTWTAPGAAASLTVDVGLDPLDLVVADVDGDDAADVVTIDAVTQTLTFLRGDGTRGLGARRDLLTRDDAVSDEPYAAAPARLYEADHDPAAPRTGSGLDLAVICRLTARLVLFRNRDGRGDLQREQILDTAGEPLSVAVGDLDGDAPPEIVVACNDGNVVSLYDRGADGRYALVEHVAVGNEPLRVALANVDGLGLREVVLLNYSPSLLSVLRPVPGGSPRLEPVPGSAAGAVALPHGLAVGALDEDGRDDVVATNYFVGSLTVGFGRADGTFDLDGVGLPGLTTPVSVALGRLDGPLDPFPDVVASTAQGLAVFRGVGPRAFAAPEVVATGIVGTNQANELALLDVDRDGWTDLLVEDTNESTAAPLVNRPSLHVLHGDGAGGFHRHHLYLTAHGPLSVAHGDLTGDGKPDVVLCAHHGDATGTARRVSILAHR